MAGLLILSLIFLGPILLGIGWGLGQKIQARIERKKIQELLKILDGLSESIGKGRVWLAEFIAEARKALDEQIEMQLRYKKHPARKSADVVKGITLEKRELLKQVKILEYQLRSYEEYFPFLEEYRDVILNEQAALRTGQDNVELLESIDPVHVYLDKAEYDKLPSVKRNQLALERYIGRSKSNWEIGRLYERYLGYLYESGGWKVIFQGAILGYEDFGRDLICEKNGKIEIVQAKCWSKEKLIREKYIFQLFGTVIHYRKRKPGDVTAVFATTTYLSEEAKEVADALSVRVDYIPLRTDYPMVKCNVSSMSGEKIYHLPFDQQYDKVVIGDHKEERYVITAKEAESLGFRRAFRYIGDNKDKSVAIIHKTKQSSGRRIRRR